MYKYMKIYMYFKDLVRTKTVMCCTVERHALITEHSIGVILAGYFFMTPLGAIGGM